jgi:hypothetical protein
MHQQKKFSPVEKKGRETRQDTWRQERGLRATSQAYHLQDGCHHFPRVSVRSLTHGHKHGNSRTQCPPYGKEAAERGRREERQGCLQSNSQDSGTSSECRRIAATSCAWKNSSGCMYPGEKSSATRSNTALAYAHLNPDILHSRPACDYQRATNFLEFSFLFFPPSLRTLEGGCQKRLKNGVIERRRVDAP